MGKKLVIVESPAKVKTISKFLGSDYIVTASYGHCYQIDPKSMSIDIENGYEPKYIPSKDKKKVIDDLKLKIQKCDMVYLATDPDREGEAIAANIRDFIIKNKKPIQRVTFQEITKKAILAAFQNPGVVNEQEYEAQKARSVLDRLVGYGVSPVLWKKVCKGTSAGRVQSIGLKIITERQKEIDAFVPEEFWTIDGKFKLSTNDVVDAKYKTSADIKNEDEAKEITEKISSVKSWSIKDIKETDKKNNPGPIFKTSTLQQTASSILGWSSKKTMSAAQALYEGFSVNGGDQSGLITYHRTDSLNISKDAMSDCRKLITKNYGPKYLPAKPRFFKTGNKSAQEAHEGIRPTHLEYSLSAVKASIPADAYKLYELIYSKFIASQMTPAETKTTSIVIASDDEEHIFTSSGQRTVFDGYYKAWKYGNHKDSIMPEVKEGEVAEFQEVIPEQHFTKPPAYFNDGSLVKVLEEEGVGRPSTYASIIDTLITRQYVSRDGKKLKGEDLGRLVSDYLIPEFPELMDNGYTSRIEGKLDEIADGKVSWVKVVDDFYKELQKRITAAASKQAIKKDIDTGILCPKCGKHNLSLKRSKYGEFYGCMGFFEKGADQCKASFKIGPNKEPIAKAEPEYLKGHVCDVCGSKIAVRVAKSGKNKGNKFYGCSGFPKCKRIFDENGNPQEFKKKEAPKKKPKK
jgi:DNA topoisomerase-1